MRYNGLSHPHADTRTEAACLEQGPPLKPKQSSTAPVDQTPWAPLLHQCRHMQYYAGIQPTAVGELTWNLCPLRRATSTANRCKPAGTAIPCREQLLRYSAMAACTDTITVTSTTDVWYQPHTASITPVQTLWMC